MARLGGFEAAPRIAVGVSGGADSLALALLARGWAAGRGGAILALTVDHGLRPESADETRRVAAWMAARSIPHAALRWDGDKPSAGIQAAAREARHRLLAERCRSEGILHLALAHHADDQVETVLLRFSRGSGVDGLAGMASVRWDGDVRLIRPLLDVRHTRLVATCQGFGQEWIEDPSNHAPAYARGRLRAAASVLGAEGLSHESVCATARRAGRARNTLETLTADLLARTAQLYPEGWVRLDPAGLVNAPEELGLRALARILACVGGAAYPPRIERLERLFEELCAGLTTGRITGRTLGGCRIIPRGDGLLITREPGAVRERLLLPPGGEVWWDHRFRVRLGLDAPKPLTVACLGAEGWKSACKMKETQRVPLRAERESSIIGQPAREQEAPRLTLPEPVRMALPALWDGGTLVSVPGLPPSPIHAETRFVPAYPLAGAAFPVVKGQTDII